MARKTLPAAELLGWLNSEIATQTECDDCRFTSVTRLLEKDDDGCNWSSANFRCSGRPVEPCRTVANAILANARSRFDLGDD